MPDEIIRKKLMERRDDYLVEYLPADSVRTSALLQLTFFKDKFDHKKVPDLIEQELERWLNRYPVPTTASAFNVSDDPICFSDKNEDSFLSGFKMLETNTITKNGGYSKMEKYPLSYLRLNI
jgi:hypothetical protein